MDSATIQAVTGMFQRAGYALPQREIEPPPESNPAEPGSDGASGEGSSEEDETNAPPRRARNPISRSQLSLPSTVKAEQS
ncbi:hypothetical protein [Pseudoglutamicibacter albus]|uniref:hypothetical protein n=1 Tax=Pseudoglutamicibacter albus TaxID=98671 RepID=UPI003605F0DC